MEVLPLIKGLLSLLLPAEYLWLGGEAAVTEFWGKGSSAAYYYGVWLKHLTLSMEAGMGFPRAMAEIGPGDSLGVGIAALLSGVSTYHAFDVMFVDSPDADVAMVPTLAAIMAGGTLRPKKGWPDYDHLLEGGSLPPEILARLPSRASLTANLIAEIVSKLKEPVDSSEGLKRSWRTGEPPGGTNGMDGSYDFLMSHSVLEYVSDLDSCFARCRSMLRSGGWMSHQIDLTSLGITTHWNGHLAYPDRLWRIACGRRRFVPNRKLASDYIRSAEANGFHVVKTFVLESERLPTNVAPSPQFKERTPQDLSTRGLFVIAQKAN